MRPRHSYDGARVIAFLRGRERASVVHYHRYAFARLGLVAVVGAHWIACVWFAVIVNAKQVVGAHWIACVWFAVVVKAKQVLR
ncbi:hypothetical protein T484DRAFT_1855599 [Baffinella frigidus]|nr:hypothetical protein T484DRAFT_1855599 [Cryptophyta sp. CCMP2293]